MSGEGAGRSEREVGLLTLAEFGPPINNVNFWQMMEDELDIFTASDNKTDEH